MEDLETEKKIVQGYARVFYVDYTDQIKAQYESDRSVIVAKYSPPDMLKEMR